jgi:AcrR family transcriptional regulator
MSLATKTTTAPTGVATMEQRILRAARRRIETFGYRRTSMAEVARDAGIAVGTVYRFFKGKEELFLAVLRDLNARWLAEARRALEGPGDAMERMKRLGAASVRVTAENGLLASLLGRDTEIIFAPLLDELFEEFVRQQVEMMTAVVREGIAEGTFRDVDPEHAAYVLFAAGHALSQQRRHPYGALMSVFELIVYEGLLPRPEGAAGANEGGRHGRRPHRRRS